MDLRNSPLLRRLILSSGLRFTGMLVAIVAGLFLTPYMFAKLGSNDCGLMVIVGTIISLMMYLEAGLNAAVSRHVAAALGVDDEKLFLNYFNSGIFLFACIGVVVILLTWLISVNLEHFVAVSQWIMSKVEPAFIPESLAEMDEKLQRNISLTRTLLMLTAVQVALDLMTRALVGVISGALREDVTSAVILGLRVLRPVVSIAVLYFGGDVVSLNVATLLLVVMMCPVWYFTAKRVVPQLRFSISSIDWASIKKLYKFGFFAFVAVISVNLHSAAAVLVLTAMYGLDTVAVYSWVCFTLFCYGKDVITMLTNYLAPIFAQLGAQKQVDTIRKALFFAVKVSSGAAVFVVFGLIAWGHPFILRWMGADNPEMLAAYPPLVLLSIVVLLEQSQAPTVEYLYGTATHKYYALINIVEACIAIALFPILAWKFQMLGIAMSLLSAGIVGRLILQPYFVCKVMELPRRIYYARFGMILLKGGVSVILPGIVTWLLIDATFPRLFLVGGLSALLYGPVYVFLCFTKDERDLVWNAVFRKGDRSEG